MTIETGDQGEWLRQRDSLDERLRLTKQRIEEIHVRLGLLRIPLAEFESRARRAHARRRAAVESRRITMAAARAAGLGSVRTTRVAMNECQQVIDAATEDIRQIVALAAGTCEELEAAWSELRERRAAEMEMLEHRLKWEHEHPVIAIAETKERSFTATELERSAALRDDEARARERDLEWTHDTHFDPHYDAHEIQLRRSRPWV